MFKNRSNANLQKDMFKMSLWDTLTRRKTFDEGGHLHSELRRCLSVLDVMFIAVGHMIGAGIFVLTGSVVRNTAGPSIILSFLMAGFAALLSAFSYAEFGARFPRAGSAYTYAYVGVGELWAFIIGWTVLLEYMIGNAAVARSWSAYFDTLIGGRLSNLTIDTIGEMAHSGGFFSQYLDILAFLLIVAVAIAVALGSKASANVNTTFVLLNVTVLVIVIVCGFIYADFSLWFGSTDDGTSKFFPYGFSGTLAGAATCFFAFIGFEALGSASEEAKNPSRTIPMATFGSLTLVTTLYVLMAATLTLMLPYDQIHPSAAYAEAFASKGATIPKYVITVGALAGMINNLVTGAFALPRSVYAMADDGLIFKWFGRINKRTLVPLNAIIVFTLLNGIIAAVFDLEALVEFLSIGTLLAYSIVSACVIILRHQPAPIQGLEEELDDGGQLADWLPFRDLFSSWESSSTIVYGVVAMLASNFWLALCFRFNLHTHIYGMVMCGIAGVFILLAFTFILAHKQNSLELSYKVPFVPFIPSLGLLINCFMMAFLNWLTWVRMVVWMAIGLVIYFGYGIRHSKEGKKLRAVQDGSHRVPRHIAPPSVVKA